MIKPYYKKGKFALYQANSLDFLANAKENSVDMIFADPPYLLSNGGFTVHAGKMVSVNKGEWDVSNGYKKDFEFHLAWIKACHRVLKPGGTIWISGTYHSIYQCGFALQVNHFHILNDIAWFKPNASPNLSCRFFTASHETLIWARKDKKGKHKFNYKLMKEGDWQNDFLKKPNMQMRSVWAIQPPKNGEKKFGKHPTQKPFELSKKLIKSAMPKSDGVVLVPFVGTGSECAAAKELDQSYIGFEINPDYVRLAEKMIDDKRPVAKLF